MVQTPEGRVKKMVKKALDTLGADCWRFMPVQSGFGSVALDFLLAIRGRFVAIETKAPGKKLTPLQEGTKAAIEAAGGIVLVVWDETSLELAMKIILALEFAPNAPQRSAAEHIRENLDVVRDGGRSVNDGPLDFVALHLASEKKRPGKQHLRAKLKASTIDAAIGGHHGAPGAASKRQAEPAACRDDQRITAAVSTDFEFGDPAAGSYYHRGPDNGKR